VVQPHTDTDSQSDSHSQKDAHDAQPNRRADARQSTTSRIDASVSGIGQTAQQPQPHMHHAAPASDAQATTTGSGTTPTPTVSAQVTPVAALQDATPTVGEADSDQPVTSAVTTPTAAAPLAGAHVPTPAAQAPAVHPGQVVSQIAHQAELFRLPGNRGVRIQLHPDDLGGVQVTLRYAGSGSLELHINVEHASTGALVEAGWTQLRDALATQGINPDKLVMSITAPQAAAASDFSSNNSSSGFQSDSGLASYTSGGDSGERRNDGGAEGGSRRWSRAETLSSTPSRDDTSTASVAASSRIDYRV
jgi:flagellar hook-length control protein FliK